MPTARANRLRAPRAAQRGQVMPIFALVVGIIVMLSSLLIDGTFFFQASRDLDTIAYHAARAGANETSSACNRQPGSNCPLTGAAVTVAKKWASDWAAQSGITLAANNATVVGDTITVHLRVCYRFFIPIVPVGSAACPGSWQIDTTQVARSLVGP